MKIKCRSFKDYYDHVQHLYGGGDEKVIYEREMIDSDLIVDYPLGGAQLSIPRPNPNADYCFAILAFCGKPILLKQQGKQASYPPNDFSIATIDDLIPLAPRYGGGVSKNSSALLVENTTVNDKLIKVSKLVDAPVFIISGGILLRIPNLGEVGLAKYISAEQCYQEIALFISSVLRIPPDMTAISAPSDKEKVEIHGFDKKVSFRHRK